MEEKIIGAIYGVIKSGERGHLYIGAGKATNPENTIFITNYRVIFAAVPVAGEGKILEGVDLSMMNAVFNKKTIEEKGNQMISKMSPQQILEFNENNYEIPFNQIREIKLQNSFWGNSIIFTTLDEKKYAYMTREKEQIEKMKEIFSQYLPGKVK